MRDVLDELAAVQRVMGEFMLPALEQAMERFEMRAPLAVAA